MNNEIRKIKVFEATVVVCLVIVTCFASVALFSWVKRHNNLALGYVDLKVAGLESKVTELEFSIARKIKESEVAMLQELLTHLKERDERDVAEVFELVEQREEEVIDSIPCCGGEDNLTNVDATEENFFVLRGMRIPKSHDFITEEVLIQAEERQQELEDFRASLDEEGLAELERRKKEQRELYKESFLDLGLSDSDRHQLIDRLVNGNALSMMMADREFVVGAYPKRWPDSFTWEEIREEAEVLRALGEELLFSDE